MKIKNHIHRESLTRDRMTVILTLLSVIVVTVGALHVSKRISLDRLRNSALKEAQTEAKTLQTISNAIFSTNEWIVNSFLCSFTNLSVIEEGDSLYYRHSIPDNVLKKLSAEEIGRRLQSFLTYNEEHLSYVFILEPGTVNWAPDGVAVSVRDSVQGWTDLLKDYDLFGHKFYKEVSESSSPKSKISVVRSSNVLAYTYGIPLFDERGKFIGEFWSDSEISEISKSLRNYKDKEDLYVSIVSRQGVIAACSESEFNGCDMREMLTKFFKQKVSENWYRQMLKIINSKESGMIETEIKSGSTISYFTSIKGTDMVVIVVKSSGVVFRKAEEFLHTQAWINGLATLAVVLILIPVFFRFKKENDANKLMQGELDVAASIQRSILPSNPGENGAPAIPGVDVFGFQKQARSVGGDLFDYVVKGNLLHFCIGDISGKGIPAALMMTQVCSLYRNRIKHEDDPSVIVSDLNGANLGREKEKFFCTMFAAVLDIETGQIKFCNAGHNPPMIYRKDSGELTLLRSEANLPVFAFDNYPYTDGQAALNPGDKLILYTDGVTEAMHEGKFFGEEAMLNAVREKAGCDNKSMVRYLLNKVQKFAGTSVQNDDITILCIEYRKAYDNNN